MIKVAEQRHPGCEVVIVDEQGTSGSDLSKRHTFRSALGEIKSGRAHGIVAYDISRLTRDQFGIDGANLAKLLVDHHAVLVTLEKDYYLREGQDLTQYGINTWLAGMDWRKIRDTFWSGLFKTMETSAVFRRPPLGYMTVREFGDKPGTLIKYPAKNPEHAHVMDGIGLAFEACQSIQACCAWLTSHGYARPAWQFRDKEDATGQVIAGKVVDYWSPKILRYMLVENEIYTGTFVFGKNLSHDPLSDDEGERRRARRSPVWEATHRLEGGTIRTEVPSLAYWPLSDVARWRRKLMSSRQGNNTQSRTRKYPHPLVGVLNCGVCGKPFVGAGKGFYRCQGTTTVQCDQWMSAGALLRALKPLLPGLLDTARGLAEEWQRAASQRKASSAANELIAVEARATRIRAKYMDLEGEDPAMKAELESLNRRIKALKAKVKDEDAEAAGLGDTAEIIEALTTLPCLFDAMPEDRQQRIFALLLSDLRLVATGRRGGRRYTVQVAEPRLGYSLSGQFHPSLGTYAGIFVDLLAVLSQPC